MFHATSAGNIAGPANKNSRWSAAALRSDLENQFGLPMTPLRNTAAVENLGDTGSTGVRARLPVDVLEPERQHRHGGRGRLLAPVRLPGREQVRHVDGLAGRRRARDVLWSTSDAHRAADARADGATDDRRCERGGERRGTEYDTTQRRHTAALDLDQAAAPTSRPPGRYATTPTAIRRDEDDPKHGDAAARPRATATGAPDLNGDGPGGTEKAPPTCDRPPGARRPSSRRSTRTRGRQATRRQESYPYMQAPNGPTGRRRRQTRMNGRTCRSGGTAGRRPSPTESWRRGAAAHANWASRPPARLWTNEPPAAPGRTPGDADRRADRPAPDGRRRDEAGHNTPHPEPGKGSSARRAGLRPA